MFHFLKIHSTRKWQRQGIRYASQAIRNDCSSELELSSDITLLSLSIIVHVYDDIVSPSVRSGMLSLTRSFTPRGLVKNVVTRYAPLANELIDQFHVVLEILP